MPVQYSFREGILTLELVGTYEPADVIRTFARALDDPRCPASVGLLVDVTRSQSLASRPAEDVRRVAESLGPHADRIGHRCAVVASEDVHFGLARLGATRSEQVGVSTRVFRSRDEALQWLGATPVPPA